VTWEYKQDRAKKIWKTDFTGPHEKVLYVSRLYNHDMFSIYEEGSEERWVDVCTDFFTEKKLTDEEIVELAREFLERMNSQTSEVKK